MGSDPLGTPSNIKFWDTGRLVTNNVYAVTYWILQE
jgi:hypothetical protein